MKLDEAADVLQVEQLFPAGNPAIEQQLFHVDAPEVPRIAPAAPECEGQLSIAEDDDDDQDDEHAPLVPILSPLEAAMAATAPRERVPFDAVQFPQGTWVNVRGMPGDFRVCNFRDERRGVVATVYGGMGGPGGYQSFRSVAVDRLIRRRVQQ
jgi:hypothetical protein